MVRTDGVVAVSPGRVVSEEVTLSEPGAVDSGKRSGVVVSRGSAVVTGGGGGAVVVGMGVVVVSGTGVVIGSSVDKC